MDGWTSQVEWRVKHEKSRMWWLKSRPEEVPKSGHHPGHSVLHRLAILLIILVCIAFIVSIVCVVFVVSIVFIVFVVFVLPGSTKDLYASPRGRRDAPRGQPFDVGGAFGPTLDPPSGRLILMTTICWASKWTPWGPKSAPSELVRVLRRS